MRTERFFYHYFIC